MEDIFTSPDGIFNKSQMTEESLIDWLQESENYWDDKEDFELHETFHDKTKIDKSHFFRLLRRSKSLESLKAADSPTVIPAVKLG